jgi:hypothetical protein
LPGVQALRGGAKGLAQPSLLLDPQREKGPGDIEYYTKAPSDNNGVTGRWSPLFAAFQNEGMRGEGEGEGEGVEVVGVEGEADDAGDRTQSDVEVVPL